MTLTLPVDPHKLTTKRNAVVLISAVGEIPVTLRGHRCILGPFLFLFFSIVSVDRKHLGDLYFIAFALKQKVLEIVKELISAYSRSHYVMQSHATS